MKKTSRFLAALALTAACAGYANAEQMSDSAIKDRVLAAINSDPDIHQKGSVNVEVRNGTAMFSGTVDNHRTIDAMLSQALMVQGVRNIESDVSVKGYNDSLRARYNAEKAYKAEK